MVSTGKNIQHLENGLDGHKYSGNITTFKKTCIKHKPHQVVYPH